MKKLIEEVQGEGLVKFLGERITLFCANYIYTGKLISVNDDCILLSDCGIVYETGKFNEPQWKDYQVFPNQFYVMKQSIESFGILK